VLVLEITWLHDIILGRYFEGAVFRRSAIPKVFNSHGVSIGYRKAGLVKVRYHEAG